MELALDDRSASPSRSGDALADTLIALGERVAPVALARERTLPVDERLVDLFAERGLVRGRITSCVGPAATSLAFSLLAPAVQAGAWLAVVDLPTIGLDAAGEFGVPLERVVAVDSGGDPQRWPDVVAAAADGFDVLLVRAPAELRPAMVRKLTTRIQQRGAVVVVLGDPGVFGCDGVIRTETAVWSGVGAGHGHLRERMVTATATGRRLPGHRQRELALPG